MSKVKRFRADHRHVVETEFDDAQFVGVADFDRVTAERDAALAELAEIKESMAYRGSLLCRIEGQRDALQQRLTAADERVDVLEGLLRTSLAAMNRIYSAGRDFIVGAGSDCDSVELMMENDPTAREIRAALKPAEPAKDEHVCTGCGNKGWTANCKECVPY